MNGDVWRIVTGLGILAALVVMNAYFVAAEYSLVVSRRYKIEQMASNGDGRARQVERAIADLKSYISATQVGITVAGLALGAFGEPVIGDLVAPLFAWLPSDLPLLSPRVFTAALSLLIVTYITVLVSELIPKRLAIQIPERVALCAIGPLKFFLLLFRPLIWVLNISADFLLGQLRSGQHASSAPKKAGKDNENAREEAVEELRALAEANERSGILGSDELQLMDRVFMFQGVEAQQVMVPRTQIMAVAIDTRIADAARPAYDGAMVYSRLPVYDGTIDRIRGFVHLKDILAALRSGHGDECIGTIKRPILIVPESIPVDNLTQELRRRRMHIAILVDDFGGTSGLVTMENCLEVLMLHIEDEDDPQRPESDFSNASAWTFDGHTLIEDVQAILPLGDVNGGYRTIAGYVIEKMGRIPREGDTVETERFSIRVDRMDRLRVARVTLCSSPRNSVASPPEQERPDRNGVLGRETQSPSQSG